MSCDEEHRLLAGFMAVVGVFLGAVTVLSLISVGIAIWRSGIAMVLTWSAVIAAFYYASRFLYRLIMKNEWIK